MGKKLTEADYKKSAAELNCEPAAIKAVATVESGGRSGFDSQGRLVARFEGHKFRKWTNGKYDLAHPNISYPYKIQKSKPHGYPAFSEAMGLDPRLAMISTSWGMFQPMGEYFDECGYDSVDEMVTAYRASEGNQLAGFVKQIKARGLDDELRRLDWAGFAKNYNGADYRSNKYDTKMAAAYRKAKASGFVAMPLDEPDAPSVDVAEAPAQPSVAVEHADNVTAAQPAVKGGAAADPAQPVEQVKPSLASRVAAGTAAILTPLSAAGITLGSIKISVGVVYGLIALTIVGLVIGAWIYNRSQDRAARLTELQLLNRARPQEINVALKQE